MNTKEKFKSFVKEHPRLLKYTKTGEMTWQKFYEIYDMYGESDEAWKDYLTEEKKETIVSAPAQTTSAVPGLADMMNFVKNIDIDSVQSGVSSLQRVLGVLQDFGGNQNTVKKEEYKPRPLYKHFED